MTTGRRGRVDIQGAEVYMLYRLYVQGERFW